MLPESPVFDYLEGRIPHPASTYLKLTEIIEAEEKVKINKEIASRRSRLGARPGSVEVEVKREVLGTSPLEELYQNILNWSDDEELRRQIDCKLLQHAYDKLQILPKENKSEQRSKVENWARGLVILKYPFELAWNIILEWTDCESIGEHEANVLREYVQHFPQSGLGTVLKAYLESEISPFPPMKEEGDKKDGKKPLLEETEHMEDEITPEDRLELMSKGLKKSPKSILCYRILGEYCLLLEQYENAVDLCQNGKKNLIAESQRVDLPFQKNKDALAVTLATALIHYQAPKNHPESRILFEDVLKRNKMYGSALVGLGLILEEQQDYEGAVDLLKKALEKDPNNVKIMAEAAWCNVLSGNHNEGREELEKCLEMVKGIDPKTRDLKAQILWRIGSALWNSDEEARSDRSGAYSYFIQALQNNQNFAPAYTSLGIYYADIAKDIGRANKCFQKAFEISAGEVEAAERLARSFAESREWELVEIVARRVADADKKRSVPGKGISWPHSAIGVVELNAQNYPLAIQYFQTALKLSPTDLHSWVGLGEAYASSGRYMAAMKVFHQAEKLDNTNWFTKYMLANVKRELGEHEEACAGYRSVLELRKNEFGVLVALSETLLSAAWHYVETGFFGRAVESSIESLEVAREIVKDKPDAFNLWKTVGDCCLFFSWVQSFADKVPRKLILELLEEDIERSEFDILKESDGVGASTLDALKKVAEEDGAEKEIDDSTACLYLGILAYKRAIYATAEDRHAHAVAWFNLGCAEYRAYVSLPQRDMKHRLAAIKCFKRTIKLEPGNHEFWNALGIATAELNPKVAQHAILRALYINDKNARVWTNLGTLYLIQGDQGLANEAFSKAQSADPEYALAWVGQGIIAALIDEAEEAQGLFEHAFSIAESPSTAVKRQFATATFDMIVGQKSDIAFASLLRPVFALQKLNQQLAQDPISIHLGALFDERIRSLEPAAASLEILCEKLEQRYEETESGEDLMKYAQAKADLARSQLGLKDYSTAIENATLALDLSSDIEKLTSCRLSAHLTAGLSYYYQNKMDESLEMFKDALSESEESPDVICLLAQVLWAKGGEEEKDVAREQLFACIEQHPDHLQSILLLGTIGALDNSEVVEAVMDDLQAVRGREGLDRATIQDVDYLLSSIAQLQGHDAAQAATTAIFLRPSLSGAWSNLSVLANDQNAAEMALKVAVRGKVDAEELALAYARMGVISCDQKAIMVAPWKVEGWMGLVEDVKATT
ncbi:Superkiller protein 3 [Rhizina undulata]